MEIFMPTDLSGRANAFLLQKLSPEDYVLYKKLVHGEDIRPSSELEAPISVLGELSTRARNCLHWENILSIGDLVTYSLGDGLLRHALTRMPNMGKKTADEILDALHKLGWSDDEIHATRYQKQREQMASPSG